MGWGDDLAELSQEDMDALLDHAFGQRLVTADDHGRGDHDIRSWLGPGDLLEVDARAELGGDVRARESAKEFFWDGWHKCAEFGIFGMPMPEAYYTQMLADMADENADREGYECCARDSRNGELHAEHRHADEDGIESDLRGGDQEHSEQL